MSKPFAARVFASVDHPPFTDSWKQLVFKWAHDFYHEYKTNIGAEIEQVFTVWSASREDKEVEYCREFLTDLSQQYVKEGHEINVEYLLHEAEKRFNMLRYQELRNSLETAIQLEDVVVADEAVSGFKTVSMGTTSLNPFTDVECVAQAFSESFDDLITWDGPFGEFLTGQMGRECFVSLQGPEKRGKSLWLMEFAFRALQQGRRVAFFECGDMSQNQVLRRFYTRLCRRPIRDYLCGRIGVPHMLSWDSPPGDRPRVQSLFLDVRSPLSFEDGAKKAKQFIDVYQQENTPDILKLSCHANSTLTVRKIDSLLGTWERQEGFIPDVVILDYADILLMESASKEFRHRVNETWMALRRLSQERRCLVLTATQADSASYKGATQSMNNFSEDKRKLSHVTGLLGLNQTEDEKREGLFHLNWLVLREGDLAKGRSVWVGVAPEVGQMGSCSIWPAVN